MNVSMNRKVVEIDAFGYIATQINYLLNHKTFKIIIYSQNHFKFV